jgi:hypothetical protein
LRAGGAFARHCGETVCDDFKIQKPGPKKISRFPSVGFSTLRACDLLVRVMSKDRLELKRPAKAGEKGEE